jgi:hypothetical protein
MKNVKLLAFALAIAAAPACSIGGDVGDDEGSGGNTGGTGGDTGGDGDPGSDPDPNPGNQPDPNPDPDPQPGNCLVQASYATVPAAANPIAFSAQPGGKLAIFLPHALNDDQAPDVLLIEIWDGYGAFTDGLRTGTFPITGDETNILECGVCVSIGADVVEGAGPGKIYVASGGSMSLQQVSASRIQGSLSNVTLREVTISEENGQQEVAAGCTTSIGSFSFDAPVQPIPQQ